MSAMQVAAASSITSAVPKAGYPSALPPLPAPSVVSPADQVPAGVVARVAGRPLVRVDLEGLGSVPASAAPDLRDVRQWSSGTPVLYPLPSDPALALQRAFIYAQPFLIPDEPGQPGGALNQAQAIVLVDGRYYATPLGLSDNQQTQSAWAAIALDGPTAAGFAHRVVGAAALDDAVQAVVGVRSAVAFAPAFQQALASRNQG